MRVMLATQAADLDFSEGREKGLTAYWAEIEALLQRVGPMYLSTKLDGVRGATSSGKVMSRTWKPIRSDKIQEVFGFHFLDGLDGEFIANDANDPNAMQAATSATSKKDSEIVPTYHIFDYHLEQDLPFSERYGKLQAFDSYLRNLPSTPEYNLIRSHIKVIPQVLVSNAMEVKRHVERFIEEGYEGGMLRSPASPYKTGRSTLREAYLLKVKIWEDAEAEVLYAYEAMHNTNEAEFDERGYTKRSSAKAGKVPAGYLGGLHVKDIATDVEFDIGIAVRGAWSLADRKALWSTAPLLIGKILTYRHFPTGVVSKPRFPKFVAWRDDSDRGEE